MKAPHPNPLFAVGVIVGLALGVVLGISLGNVLFGMPSAPCLA